MHAAWFEKFGTPEKVLQVGELPTPKPGPGEVLVEIHTSGVNPSDVKKRAGAFPNLLDEGLIVPHSDGAGVITAVGDNVSTQRVGERVWLYQAQFGRRFGTAAQYINIDESRAPSLPDNVSFEVGACLGIPVMTAHRCVFADGPVENQRVLVTGGAGRVGYYAIQFARQAGAFVITTASNDVDKDACFEAGAHAVVNHRVSGWANDVLNQTDGKKIDRVVDVEFGANLPEILECIDTGATIATYASVQVPEPSLPFLRMMFMDLTIRLVIVYSMPEAAKTAAIGDIYRALSEERIKHRVAHTLSLDEIARSHELIESGGSRGCVVLSTQ